MSVALTNVKRISIRIRICISSPISSRISKAGLSKVCDRCAFTYT